MKKAKLIFISLFVALCLVPSAGMLLFGEAQPAANEVLAAKPAITTRSGEFNLSFLSDVSDYIADRFAFRRSLPPHGRVSTPSSSEPPLRNR